MRPRGERSDDSVGPRASPRARTGGSRMSRRTLTAVAAVVAALGWLSVARADRPDGPPHGPGFGPGPGGPDPARMAERLGLSEDQQAQWKALREKDREASRPLFEATRQAH